ncbi:MAG: enoyl-CoA hydratase/isomerase family protein [Proteobacteria bacterium]|nr:enoyl-CoA hydratase/isomerase family protein [Pseudomonadota bacterium]
MSELVLREDKDGLCTLTLNRPQKLNALNHAVFKELDAHIAYVEAHAEKIGCVILRGAGRSFCAGHDLDDISGGGEGRDVAHFETRTIERLSDLPMPVVTVVQGHCLTGGLELALGGDIVIAAESAKFADTHGKWDLVPVWGMSQRLPRRVGRAKAMEMMFTSRTYSGRQAEAIGLANICVPDAELDVAVATFAKDVLANSWRSNRANKKLLNDTDGMTLKAGLAHELHRSIGRGTEMAERLARMRK